MSEPGACFTFMLGGAPIPDHQLIGGKAWSLARMSEMGLPVPPAFVVTTEACREYYRAQRTLPEGLFAQLLKNLGQLERMTGRTLGALQQPLFLSVRSGAAISMPGMMDTVLNLGISDATEAALAAETGSPVFAHDVHRRFCDMFARIVLRATVDDLDPSVAPHVWRAQIAAAGSGEIPASTHEQLRMAVQAVFDSWNTRRAKRYREHHGIDHDLGTAVTVQAMVFGNLDQRSGTGVVFSRNPLTGSSQPYGEYLPLAQGEDVVSGACTPLSLDRLEQDLPEAHSQLLRAAAALEGENGDVQDIEFTIERGKLYLLQSRSAKRSPAAAVKIAVDMVHEGRIAPEEALARVAPEQVRMLLRPHLAAGETESGARVLATGEAACPGVGVGIVVADADSAEREARAGKRVVLARVTTSPEDVHGMMVADAVITERGGATSHAAVVSRALGVPCVVGCGAGVFNGLGGQTVTVDGGKGRVFAGALRVEHPSEQDHPALVELCRWAAARAPLKVFRIGEPIPAGVFDLETIAGGEDPERVGELLRGARGAIGSVLASDRGVRAALAAGVEFIVVRQVLPALLAACMAR